MSHVNLFQRKEVAQSNIHLKRSSKEGGTTFKVILGEQGRDSKTKFYLQCKRCSTKLVVNVNVKTCKTVSATYRLESLMESRNWMQRNAYEIRVRVKFERNESQLHPHEPAAWSMKRRQTDDHPCPS